MKKFLVLFVGLAILAGSVSALDLPDALKIPGLVVTGDVATGFRVTGESWNSYNDVDGDTPDPVAFAYSSAIDDGTPFRAQLQLVWTRGNLGVKTRLRYRPDAAGDLNDTLSDLNSTVNKAFVWGDLLDKKVRVTAGKGLDGAWGLFYSNFKTTGDYDGVDGVKVEVKPIDGLNLGVAYGADIFAKSWKNSWENGYTDAQAAEKRLVVGAKYSTPAFGLVASLYHNLKELDDGATYSVDAYDIPDGDITGALPRTSNLIVGAKVTPPSVPLTVNVSAAFKNLGSESLAENKNITVTDNNGYYKGGDYNPYWYGKLKANVEYGVNDALSIGVALSDIYFADGYYLGESKTDGTGGAGGLPPVSINPYVGYALNDDISLGGDLTFKINQGGSDQFAFAVQPTAEFSLGSGAKFTVFDELVFYGASPNADDAEWVGKHNGAVQKLFAGGASGTANTFHIEFGWTF
jgi:hypothetical protein